MNKKIKIALGIVIIGLILWSGEVLFAKIRPQTFPQYLKTLMGRGKVKASPENQVIFLGDSITYRENWNVLLGVSNIVNAGVAGDTTDMVLLRLDPIIKSNPPKIFIMIGVNDLLNGQNVDYVVENYRMILNGLRVGSPNTKIYVASMLPVNNDILKSTTINSQKILLFNQKFRHLLERSAVTYIDLYPHFSGADDQMKKEYTWDGLHPNSYGYAVWKNLLKDYLN